MKVFKTSLLFIFILSALALIMTGCGGGGDGDGDGGGGDGDTTPPTVSSTSPADGAADVDVSTSITATFSEAMDDSTITTSTFTLSSNPPVSGTVSYDSGTNTAAFTPDADLDFKTTYTATITTGAAGQAGNNMASNYTWSFTTVPALQLPETGQRTSYDANTPQRDDGALQAGVAWPLPRFTDNGDGTATDKLTGLMWTGDANAPGPAGCTTGTTMAWQVALDYVACLNTNTYLGYDDWRLPNRKELYSLIDHSQSSPALLSVNPFTNVQLSDYYWSSSTYAPSTGAAWSVNMWDGYVELSNKTNSHCVWPVRAGQ